MKLDFDLTSEYEVLTTDIKSICEVCFKKASVYLPSATSTNHIASWFCQTHARQALSQLVPTLPYDIPVWGLKEYSLSQLVNLVGNQTELNKTHKYTDHKPFRCQSLDCHTACTSILIRTKGDTVYLCGSCGRKLFAALCQKVWGAR